MTERPVDGAGPDGPGLDLLLAVDILRLLRPAHWVKNAIVFPAVVLAGHGREALFWVQAVRAFGVFCLASSAVYAFNDVFDREADRLHPAKRLRPVAAGRLTPRLALTAALALAAGAMAAALAAGPLLAGCAAGYLALNLAYSLRLKRVPVADAACVAAGFLLRAVSVYGIPTGAAREGLLSASIFALCFFTAVSKRAHDQAVAAAPGAGGGAQTFGNGCGPAGLRRLLVVSGAATLASYGLFALTVGPGRAGALLSVLPVAYCLWRLGVLSGAGVRVEQIDLVRADVRLLAAGVVWAGLWVWAVPV